MINNQQASYTCLLLRNSGVFQLAFRASETDNERLIMKLVTFLIWKDEKVSN